MTTDTPSAEALLRAIEIMSERGRLHDKAELLRLARELDAARPQPAATRSAANETCPECGAPLLVECVACSHTTFPQQPQPAASFAASRAVPADGAEPYNDDDVEVAANAYDSCPRGSSSWECMAFALSAADESRKKRAANPSPPATDTTATRLNAMTYDDAVKKMEKFNNAP